MRKLFTLSLALLASIGMWAETVDCSSASATSSTGNTNKSTSTNYAVYFTRGGGGWSVNSGKGYQGKTDGIAVFKLTKPTELKVIISNSGSNERTFTMTAKPFKTVATGDEFLSILDTSYSKPAKYADCVSAARNYANIESTSPFYNGNPATDCTLSNGELSTTLSYTTGEQTLAASAVSQEYAFTEALPAGVYAVGFSAVSNSNVSLAGFIFTDACDAPAQALVLSSNAAAEVYAGDVITFSTTGGNGGAKTLAGANSETITDSVWTATAGEHTFTASQAKNGDYCAQESELIINVAATNPVTEVTVAGESSAYVGDVLTYTATAANATAYEWYLDGAKQGSDSAKFIYTAVKGNHSIICKARNKFNKEAETETWVSSVAKALTVTSLSGTLISYEVNSDATGATNVSGLWVSHATNKVSLTKKNPVKLTVDGHEYTGYKMDKGKYVGVTLTSGTFLAGDTIAFLITSATNSAKLYLYNNESGESCLDSIPGASVTGWATFILNQATTGVYLYRFNPDVTPYNQNPYVAAVKVARPKEIASVDTALVNVKVNNVAISAANLTALLADKSLDLADEYLEAPVVKFFKKTTITYEDASKNYINDSAAITATVNGAGKWEAEYTVDEDTYTVTMAKTASFAVTYKLGSRTLGAENVVANGHPANFAQYQNQGNFATFQAWCSDAALENTVTIAEAVITKDTTFYGKFDFVYAESINIEQWILDNAADSASSVALISLLGTRHYASNIEYKDGTNELDSLTTKDDRNEPYLGLKIKESGRLLNFRLAKDTYVKIKFGAIKSEKPQVAINGGAYEEVVLTDGVYEYTATEADLVSIKTMSANAVVFKQIMINEPIADVDLPTGIEDTAAEVKAVKFFENGQMYIRRGEKVYTVTGAEVK